jgi:hypothetical protein
MSLEDIEKLVADRGKDLLWDDDDIDEYVLPSKRKPDSRRGGRPSNKEDLLELAEKQLERVLRGSKTPVPERIRAIGMAVKFREMKEGLHSQAITENVMRLLDFLLSAEEQLKISGEDAIKILTDNKERFLESMGVLRV